MITDRQKAVRRQNGDLRRLQIQAFIKEFHDQHDIGPTHKEIADAIGVTPPAIRNLMKKPMADGQIISTKSRTGTIRVHTGSTDLTKTAAAFLTKPTRDSHEDRERYSGEMIKFVEWCQDKEWSMPLTLLAFTRALMTELENRDGTK